MVLLSPRLSSLLYHLLIQVLLFTEVYIILATDVMSIGNSVPRRLLDFRRTFLIHV